MTQYYDENSEENFEQARKRIAEYRTETDPEGVQSPMSLARRVHELLERGRYTEQGFVPTEDY